MKKTHLNKFLILIVTLIAFNGAVMAQLCNPSNLPAGANAGAFDIDGNITSGCSPLTIKVKNKTGSSDVHYIFDYQGQTPSQLDWIGKRDSSDIGFASNQPRIYTILQYGKKGGQDFYACKSVTVNPNPIVSYTTCNNLVNVEIPAQKLGNLQIGFVLGSSPPKTFNESQLPIPQTPTTVSYPVNLRYYFLDNSGNKVCETSRTVNNPITATIISNPYYPNIKEIEMISPTKAKLEFTGSFTQQGYDLFMNKKNGAFSGIPILTNIQPGSHIVDIPDSLTSHCFFLERTELCGGTERSPDICTIPLQPISFNPSQNILNWDNHPLYFFNSSVALPPIFGFRNLVNKLNVNITNGTNSSATLGNHLNTKTENIDCSKDYCYQIISESNGILFKHAFSGVSKSQKRCISRKNIVTPPITNVYVSVTENSQKNELKYLDNSGWPLSKEWYIIYKSNGTTFVKHDSLKNNLSYTDLQSLPNVGSECYKIGYKDICGSYSEVSPDVCNVFLSTSKNNEDLLSWTTNNPFGSNAIVGYEILTLDEVSNNIINTKNTLLNDEKIDLSPFENEAKFKIRTTSNTGEISYSNLLKIPIEAQLFIPQVFSPNGDGLNEAFSIFGRKGRIVTFMFQIYDRWGAKIFETTEKDFKWDGKLNGKNLSSGIYLFKYHAVLNDGNFLKNTGLIELLN